MRGFGFEYHDDKSTSDRLSTQIYNGQVATLEAVTVLRNGGTATQSGLVGITNGTYNPNTGSPFIPATRVKGQATGESNIRGASGPSIVD